MGWAALDHVSPYYPLYALFFGATGLTGGEVSALFALWSVTGFLAEVPAGVLADRWSRRGCVAVAGLLEAAGFTVWTAAPGLPGFAAGFLLWGLGGALSSGAAEALVYDGLAAAGAASAYARVNGAVSAAEMIAAVPSAAAAAGLLALGGYPLVGWVSVGVCLATAALALRFPLPPRRTEAECHGSIFRAPALGDVGLVVVAVAVVGGIDAVEEYFPVMAGDWGVATAAVPPAVVAIPLTGALGAALAGRAGRLPARALAGLLAVAGLLLGAAALWGRPWALAAVAAFYGLYLAVLVLVEARLQDVAGSRYRATVTSVAALGTELGSLAVFAAWAVRGPLAVAVLVLAAVPVVATALRRRA